MYVDTIFGIKWRGTVAPAEIFYLLLVVIFAVFFYLLYKHSLKQKEIALQAKLLFEFKIKQFGLNGLQTRILNHIIDLLKLKNPRSILNNPDLFESAIGYLLIYSKAGSEDGSSLTDICKDLIITYEKLYHYAVIRKPIDKISDIDEGVLLYFFKDPSVVYIGKLVRNQGTEMKLKLFRNSREVPHIEINSNYNFYLWRSGDAEYIFSTIALSYDEGFFTIQTPDEFSRGKEVRRPYVDVIIPGTIVVSDELYHASEEPEKMQITILKFNEHEIVLRMEQKLDYRYKYKLDFQMDEFKIDALVNVIADKTISEGNLHYHTCKIIEITEAAKTVMRKFMTDRF
jgi:hypothetical protein